MKKKDPQMYERVVGWRNSLVDKEIIPTKYRELMLVCMCCMILFEDGIRYHAKAAMDNGASKEEVFNTIAQTLAIGGIPPYKVGIKAVKEIIE